MDSAVGTSTQYFRQGKKEASIMLISVGWAQRGTHLTAGTNQGRFQVRHPAHLK
ncbi:hypothetical protein DAI22_12g164800 [Oryza sativa Japonica Group]|nr:hypothetical protein DAI22_12g164800 [Oryza sativa Japonica Group]